MRLGDAVKPISYMKAHAAEMIREVAEGRRTYVITQHGEAKAVLQDLESYEQLQESVALLKMLAQSDRSLAAGHTRPVNEVLTDLRKGLADDAR
jgi:prevent-host-death family protein